MLKRTIHRLRRLARNLFWLGLAVLLLPRMVTSLATMPQRYAQTNAPASQVAIIFGAELRRDGGPSAVLRDRLDTGIALYHNGTVEKLLMSGQAPEPTSMQTYAIQQGVAPEDIWLDDAGLRTYATCYQANHTFELTEALLVTQAYHLPRAVYLCNALGVAAQGVVANQSNYYPGALLIWNVRESLATILALWEVHIQPPQTANDTLTIISLQEGS